MSVLGTEGHVFDPHHSDNFYLEALMTTIYIFHFFFIFISTYSAVSLILSQNSVHTVLLLILIFFSSASSLILFGVDFIPLLFIIIYVGAIAVLFLFIVMMLDLKTETVKEYNFINSSEFFLITYCVLYYILINSNFIHLFSTNFIVNEQFNNNLDSFFNIDIFGQSLFNYFIPCFLIAGLVLLVAMLGAIVLTLRFSANRKNQISSKQLSKNNMFLSYYN